MNSPERMPEVTFAPKALDILTQAGPQEFRRVCGDEFVRARVTVGELFGLMTIQTNSKGKKRKVSASISGSLGVFSAEASLDKRLPEISKTHSVKVLMYVSGGEGISSPTTMDQLMTLAQDFPSKVQAERGSLLIAQTQDYDVLFRQTEGQSLIDISQQSDTIRDLATSLDNVKVKEANINFISDHPDQFVGVQRTEFADARRLLEHFSTLGNL